MRPISKEDFARMNNKIEKTIIDTVYDDLRSNILDIEYSYNELQYKRLSLILDSESENGNGNLNINNNFNINININVKINGSPTINLDVQASEELLSKMKNGEFFNSSNFATTRIEIHI